MADTTSGIDGKRRNMPRGGGGKYKWSVQPHHAIQWQKDWLDLAAKLFNADADDILLDQDEKNEVLGLLAKKISDSNISFYSRAVRACRVVDSVARMCSGKGRCYQINVFTALLRYSLRPPSAWLVEGDVRQCLAALQFLERCSDGKDTYTAEKMEEFMSMKPVVAAEAAELQGRDDTTGLVLPSLRGASTLENPAPTSNSTATESSKMGLRPWTRAMTTFFSPPKPAQESNNAALEPIRKNETTPSKKASTPRKITTTPQKGKKSPAAKSASAKAKGKKAAQAGRDEVGSPTSGTLRTQRKRGAAVPADGSVAEFRLASMFKATEVLDKVARYEEECVREVALSTFVADLRRARWDDLEKSVRQLVKDADRESRAFLAGVVISRTYDRINKALDLDSAPSAAPDKAVVPNKILIKKPKPSRTSPAKAAPGGRTTRILFKSG
ncbi:hypothetical protein CTA1_11937 [Colletotrichum tanaceti]|uniref:Uncharacterized protein n=1 Tax=Colletotrichum tanaceti TaxID=1306861 RepID=A0A4U6XL01_9PEZI|nr:hypothetical protein CTA1_11937 [Colletotrichum tanaceti]